MKTVFCRINTRLTPLPPPRPLPPPTTTYPPAAALPHIRETMLWTVPRLPKVLVFSKTSHSESIQFDTPTSITGSIIHLLTISHLSLENRIFKIQSTRVISKSKGPFETLRDIRTSTYQIFRIDENINRTARFHKWIYNLTPLVRNIYWNIVEKGRNCSWFLLLFIIFCHRMLDFYVKTRTWFFLRDKWLFEIIEAENRESTVKEKNNNHEPTQPFSTYCP